MTVDNIVLLRALVRIPFYHAGIGATLIKPENKEGTFSVDELRVTVGPIEERTFEGKTLRVVEVKGNPLMVGMWLDIDKTPHLREQIGAPPPPKEPGRIARLIL